MNKESELFCLERFKENFRGFPGGMICLDEKPDFLIKMNNGKLLGIERTHYFRERSSDTKSPLQQKLATRKRIVDLAKSIYDGKRLPPLFVHVHFNLNFNCSERGIQASAEVVEQSLSESDNEVLCRRDDIPLYGVDLINVKKKLKGINLWSARFGSFVPFVRSHRIQEMLDEKNPRCAKYREKCDEAWLVIVMDRFQPSSFSLIPDASLECCYNHSFDAAFVFSMIMTIHRDHPFSCANCDLF